MKNSSTHIIAQEKKGGNRGFTLVELMITVALVGILAALSSAMIVTVSETRQNAVQALTNDFVSAIYASRNMSIRSGALYRMSVKLQDIEVAGGIAAIGDNWVVQKADVGLPYLAELKGLPIVFGDEQGNAGGAVESLFEVGKGNYSSIHSCAAGVRNNAGLVPAMNPAPPEQVDSVIIDFMPRGSYRISIGGGAQVYQVTCFFYSSNIVNGKNVVYIDGINDLEAQGNETHWMVQIDGFSGLISVCPGWQQFCP